MTRTHFLRGMAAIATLLLSACATLAPPAAPSSYHETIEMGGRLSVRYEQNGKNEAVHGSFTWSQAAQRSNVTVLSPLGQIIATIDVSPGSATLTQSGQPPRSAPDVDVLTAQALGWPLPVAGMRDWLQGVAVAADGQRFVAGAGAEQVTTRDGWRILYAGWEATAGGSRPKRIDLERTTPRAGTVAIRIVIDNWQPG